MDEMRATAALCLLAGCGRISFVGDGSADAGPGCGVPDGGFTPATCEPGVWCWQNPLPVGVDWMAVAARGNDLWMVGGAGYALHWDGMQYSVERAVIVTGTLLGVWIAANGDVFAVGYTGVIVRRVAGAWGPMPSPRPRS